VSKNPESKSQCHHKKKKKRKKIQHPYMITKKKPLKKLVIEGSCINIIKAINDKPVSNIIPNGEKQKTFPLK
jgi:hypothetical protein